MDLNLATAWEAISDEIPDADADALLCGEIRRSWREYEDRAARLASALTALPNSANVGLALYNGPAVGSRAGAVVREVVVLSVSRVSPFVPV